MIQRVLDDTRNAGRIARGVGHALGYALPGIGPMEIYSDARNNGENRGYAVRAACFYEIAQLFLYSAILLPLFF